MDDSKNTVEDEIDELELTKFLNKWLAGLSQDDRVLFMCRYWNGESVNGLAKKRGVAPSNLAKRLYGLRQSLKAMLEKEGCSI